MLTFLPLEQIAKMEKWEGSELNKAKEILAYELTELVHGKEEADKALESAKALFAGAGNAANMPTVEITDADFTDGKIDILNLLVKAGLATSRSDARRNTEQGGVSVKDVKVTDIAAVYVPEDFADEFVLRRGKKKFCKIVKA